jgi:magnesium-protoporphyrin O-methyltransferase
MHAVGRVFPRGNRAPAIEPVSTPALHRLIQAEPGLDDWEIGRSERVTCGFYLSQALELVCR